MSTCGECAYKKDCEKRTIAAGLTFDPSLVAEAECFKAKSGKAETTPVTPYQRGWEDCRKAAVDAVRGLEAPRGESHLVLSRREVVCALRTIAPKEETHEAGIEMDFLRWALMGYWVRWNEEDSTFRICNLWKHVDKIGAEHPMINAVNPGRQLATCKDPDEVDAWIAAHKRT
jgi:hypothetical protein